MRRAGGGRSMSEPPADRVQDLFDQAVALPREERTAFLEAACAGDRGLRAEVESLLACDAGGAEGAAGAGLLKSPLVRPPPTAKPGDLLPGAWLPGPQVGHYRILRRIAE